MKLTEARARKLPLPKIGSTFTFCDEVKGFGVRCSPGARSYVVQYRDNGRKQRLTLGRVGILPFVGPADAPGARDLALTALSAARRGEDPRVAVGRVRAPHGLTLAALWKAYQDAGYPRLRGVGHKRASTIASDRNRFRRYFAPRIATKPVTEIDTAVARRWLDKITQRGQRAQCLILLKSLLSFAHSRGLATVQEIDIVAEKSRWVQNFLVPSELRQLDTACAALAIEQPGRLAGFVALRLLILTGCRTSEILSAQRHHFDAKAGTLWLVRDKVSDNGREVMLSPAAVALFAALPATSSSFFFPSSAKCGHMTTLQKHADEAFARAGVERVRIHDLRHSFASAGISDGLSLFAVGRLLGHRDAASTERYSHLSREHRRTALERVSAVLTGNGGKAS
jgi:integrase